VRALHRTAAARLEDHVGQREAREVLSHVVADVGPDAEQHALALVVASAILVGFAEVTRDNRSSTAATISASVMRSAGRAST